jgi:phage terminase small subunit
MVTLKDSSALPPEVRAAVSEVKQTKDGVAIKFHSKTAALEMLARYFGMSKEKLEITGANGGAIQVRRIERVIVDPNPKR